MQEGHVPVLVDEVLEYLDPRPGGAYLDLTLGGGGHTREILLRQPTCRVLGVDRDRDTFEQAVVGLGAFEQRFRGICARFDLADEAPDGPADGEFDGALLDLGMSSLQVDDPERGFSFQAEGPLDLRMDRGCGETAAQLLRRCNARELADLLFHLGGERRSRAIARAIHERVRRAPLRTTRELAELIVRTIGGARRGRIHPATRTFQALRMAVNDELGCLERVLPRTVRWLRPGGRLVVISFHSGEDRIVKQFLRQGGKDGTLEVLTRKPVRPLDEEVRRNPRARSARLRAARSTGVHEPDMK